ncbi:MAG: preprotein translocase subunit SecD, partial [Candidatus Nanopelagicaceae bacterium]
MSYGTSQRTSGDAKKARPGRTLFVTLLLTAILGGVALSLGATSINLGLDLRGGTSVTLQPRIQDGDTGQVTPEAINQAVSIIRQRVDSLGVAESEVTAEGTGTNRQIVIAVPGETGRRIVDLVGQTAELRFRQVLVEAGSVPTPNDSELLAGLNLSSDEEARFLALDCTSFDSNAVVDQPDSVLVSCDRNSFSRYLLAPAVVVGRDVRGATAAIDPQSASGWFVSLDFNGDGTKKFGQLTQDVVN